MDNFQRSVEDLVSTDINNESLSTFKELLEDAVPETSTKIVLEKLLPHVFKSNSKSRDEILNLIINCTKIDVKYLNKTDATKFKLLCRQGFVDDIDKLQNADKSDWSILCITLFRVLGTSLHHDVDIINRVLKTIENGFRNKTVQKCESYKCWMGLIRNYTLAPSYLKQPKQMRLLIKPLKVPLSKQACVVEIRFDTFVLLLEAIGNDATNSYLDFLQFVFNIGNVSACAPLVLIPSYRNIWPKSAAVLFKSLGCEGSIEHICNYKTKIDTIVDAKYFETNYKYLVHAVRICCELTYHWCSKTNVKQIVQHLWTSIFKLSHSSGLEKDILPYILDHFNELFRILPSNDFVYDFILMPSLEIIYKNPEINTALLRSDLIIPFLKLYIAYSPINSRSRSEAVSKMVIFAYSSKTTSELYTIWDTLCYSEVLELIWFQCNGIFVSELDDTEHSILKANILTYLKWPVVNIKYLNTNECILNLWKSTILIAHKVEPDIISQILDALQLIQQQHNWIIVNIMLIGAVLTEIATKKTTTIECIATTLSECLENSAKDIKQFSTYNHVFFQSYMSLLKHMIGSSTVVTANLHQSLERFIQKLPDSVIQSVPVSFVSFMEELSRMSNSIEAMNIVTKLKPKGLHSTPTIINRSKKMVSLNYSPLLPTGSKKATSNDSEKLRSGLTKIGCSVKKPATVLASTDISGFERNLEPSHNSMKTSYIDTKKIKKSKSIKKDKVTIHTRTKSIMEFADNAFVQIDKAVSPDHARMSTHQRDATRRRRDDIPALYSDLSQSQSQSTYLISPNTSSQNIEPVADQPQMLSVANNTNDPDLESTQLLNSATELHHPQSLMESEEKCDAVEQVIELPTNKDSTVGEELPRKKLFNDSESNSMDANDIKDLKCPPKKNLFSSNTDSDCSAHNKDNIARRLLKDTTEIIVAQTDDSNITDLPAELKIEHTTTCVDEVTRNEESTSSSKKQNRLKKLQPQQLKPAESSQCRSPTSRSKSPSPKRQKLFSLNSPNETKDIETLLHTMFSNVETNDKSEMISEKTKISKVLINEMPNETTEIIYLSKRDHPFESSESSRTIKNDLTQSKSIPIKMSDNSKPPAKRGRPRLNKNLNRRKNVPLKHITGDTEFSDNVMESPETSAILNPNLVKSKSIYISKKLKNNSKPSNKGKLTYVANFKKHKIATAKHITGDTRSSDDETESPKTSIPLITDFAKSKSVPISRNDSKPSKRGNPKFIASCKDPSSSVKPITADTGNRYDDVKSLETSAALNPDIEELKSLDISRNDSKLSKRGRSKSNASCTESSASVKHITEDTGFRASSIESPETSKALNLSLARSKSPYILKNNAKPSKRRSKFMAVSNEPSTTLKHITGDTESLYREIDSPQTFNALNPSLDSSKSPCVLKNNGKPVKRGRSKFIASCNEPSTIVKHITGDTDALDNEIKSPETSDALDPSLERSKLPHISKNDSKPSKRGMKKNIASASVKQITEYTEFQDSAIKSPETSVVFNPDLGESKTPHISKNNAKPSKRGRSKFIASCNEPSASVKHITGDTACGDSEVESPKASVILNPVSSESKSSRISSIFKTNLKPKKEMPPFIANFDQSNIASTKQIRDDTGFSDKEIEIPKTSITSNPKITKSKSLHVTNKFKNYSKRSTKSQLISSSLKKNAEPSKRGRPKFKANFHKHNIAIAKHITGDTEIPNNEIESPETSVNLNPDLTEPSKREKPKFSANFNENNMASAAHITDEVEFRCSTVEDENLDLQTDHIITIGTARNVSPMHLETIKEADFSELNDIASDAVPISNEDYEDANAIENSSDVILDSQHTIDEKLILTDRLKNELNRLRMDIVGGDMASSLSAKRIRKEKFNLNKQTLPRKCRTPRTRQSIINEMEINSTNISTCKNNDLEGNEMETNLSTSSFTSDSENENTKNDVDSAVITSFHSIADKKEPQPIIVNSEPDQGENIQPFEKSEIEIVNSVDDIKNDEVPFTDSECQFENNGQEMVFVEEIVSENQLSTEEENAQTTKSSEAISETCEEITLDKRLESLSTVSVNIIENILPEETAEPTVDASPDIIERTIEVNSESPDEIMGTQPSIEPLSISFIGSMSIVPHDANNEVQTNETLSIAINQIDTETCNSSCEPVTVENVNPNENNNRDLIPTSPVSKTTPGKNQTLLNDTLDISPISTPTVLEFTHSPDLFESENINVVEKVLDGSPCKSTQLDQKSDAPIITAVIPDSNNDVSIQNIDLSKDNAPPISHVAPLKLGTTSSVVASPKTHRIQKMMQKLEDKNGNNAADSKEAVSDYNKEDLLEFSADLPKPDARPRTPSILKRKAPDFLEEGISPLSKRKRVNFSDPPTTSSKVYLKCDEENFMQRILKKSGKLSMKPHYLTNQKDMIFNIKVNIKNNASTSEPEAQVESECPEITKMATNESEDTSGELCDLYPELINCTEDVGLLNKLTNSVEDIKTKGIKTIADIVRLNRCEVEDLPIAAPKFTRVNSALSQFCFKNKNTTYEAELGESLHKIISVDCSEKSISNVNIINNIILSPKQMEDKPTGLTALSDNIKSNIQQLVTEGYSADEIGEQLNNIFISCNLPLSVNLPYF